MWNVKADFGIPLEKNAFGVLLADLEALNHNKRRGSWALACIASPALLALLSTWAKLCR
jgi:hypothetical protein